MKLNRNDPCWCGSLKKYKKCHYDFDKKLAILKNQGKEIPLPEMIKNEQQIEEIRKASSLNSELLDYIEQHIKIGMSTEDIDVLAKEFTEKHDAVCADYQYMGFPKHICTSINNVVCHGIPSKKVILQDGDIINVDATTNVNGYYGDASRMFMLGNVSKEAKQLVTVTKECLEKGIETIVPYQSCLGDIGRAIEAHASKYGYSVVQELCGHGVGLAIHEEPNVVHFASKEVSFVIVPGMIFTIEPMINAGKKDIYLDEEDNWTIFTADGKLSAQWEYTLLVTETGVEILSK
jgi:methionyl aminopeptidase